MGSSRVTSSSPAVSDGNRKTVDEVWREIVGGGVPPKRECLEEEMMTLEDYLLLKAGAAEDTDTAPVKLDPHAGPFGLAVTPFPSGDWAETATGRRTTTTRTGTDIDRLAEQRHRRMIKNRESAARSRERKQAYQSELESLAVKLEEENDRLLAEKAAHMKERLKQLMERVVPVIEKRKPPRFLKRTRSMQW